MTESGSIRVIPKEKSETDKMSNLITDMVMGHASKKELERAIRHSVIAMDYDKSAVENNIAELVEKYQR